LVGAAFSGFDHRHGFGDLRLALVGQLQGLREGEGFKLSRAENRRSHQRQG
jgi:hypothetical protein